MRASTIERESLSLNVQSTSRLKPMKIVIAQMKHEPNTFSPVATPLDRAEAYAAFKGTDSAIAAFFDLAEGASAELVIPVATAKFDHTKSASTPFASTICNSLAAVPLGLLFAEGDSHF